MKKAAKLEGDRLPVTAENLPVISSSKDCAILKHSSSEGRERLWLLLTGDLNG